MDTDVRAAVCAAIMLALDDQVPEEVYVGNFLADKAIEAYEEATQTAYGKVVEENAELRRLLRRLYGVVITSCKAEALRQETFYQLLRHWSITDLATLANDTARDVSDYLERHGLLGGQRNRKS